MNQSLDSNANEPNESKTEIVIEEIVVLKDEPLVEEDELKTDTIVVATELEVIEADKDDAAQSKPLHESISDSVMLVDSPKTDKKITRFTLGVNQPPINGIDEQPKKTCRQKRAEFFDEVSIWEKPRPKDDADWNNSIDIWTDFYGMECAECNTCFYRFEKCMQHMVKKHNGRLRCTECQLVIKVTPSQLEYHIEYHTDPEKFKCKICHSQEFDPISFAAHQTRVHGVQGQYVCSLCDTAFLKESFLEEHNREKHMGNSVLSSNEISCEECGKVFTSPIGLHCHLSSIHNIHKHESEKRVCDICGKAYYTYQGFKRHRETHLNIEKPKIKCPLCAEEVATKPTLKLHIRRRHSQQEPQTCIHCSKICRSKASLVAHIRYVHVMTPSFKCSICDKGYRKNIELQAHMSTHTGVALFECNYCPRKFNNQCNKFKHMKVMHSMKYERDRRFKTIVEAPKKAASKKK